METELRCALAEDIDQIIRLHDREIDAETLDALRDAAFPRGLALPPPGDEADRMTGALAAPLVLDELAADFAAIYLNHGYGASPYESVWLSDDHLACAAPLFELRDLYAAAGWRVADWRQRFDDHFVLQLHFIRHRLLDPAVEPRSVAEFIDEHLGYWFPDFARRVGAVGASPFYTALIGVTEGWLGRLRHLLGVLAGYPVPPREVLTRRIQSKMATEKAAVAPLRFMPGSQGPSW